jgi:response regulator RpfG family c-di-GMP phosphodiesterase
VQRSFLVVAENVKIRESLSARLREGGHTVTLAASTGEALRIVRSVSVGAVLIASDRDAGSAKKLRSKIRSIRPGCRILFVTPFEAARNSADLLRFGSGDYIVSDRELFGLLADDGSTKDETGKEAAKGTTALIDVLDVLVGLLELDDHFFGGFSHQVMRLARSVAEEMALEKEVLEEVVISTLLRDIGKADLDRGLREGQEAYTAEQTALMREHVASSVRLLEHIDMPWKVLPIIRHHHERYDGQGYPDSLKGREIPLGARIVAAVDAFMAMVSDRPHRDAMSFDEALDELERHAGAQFDPEIVEVLIRVIQKQYAARNQKAKPRILIIEPQEEYRRLLKMRLLNEGVEVEAVAELNGNLRDFKKNPPHLVLADMGDDGAEGFETLRKFREAEELHSVPFALLAEQDDRFHKLRALRQGVDDYILKTDDLEEVVARAENILTREAIRRGVKPSQRPRGVTGQIENLPLPDIVQILSIGMKTACVTLTAGKRHGKIWFRDGSLAHARAPEEEGEEAFFEMLTWDEGTFEIRHGLRTDKKTVDNDAMFLVMEGLRRIDEAGANL